jgi:hypothetical protein
MVLVQVMAPEPEQVAPQAGPLQGVRRLAVILVELPQAERRLAGHRLAGRQLVGHRLVVLPLAEHQPEEPPLAERQLVVILVDQPAEVQASAAALLVARPRAALQAARQLGEHHLVAPRVEPLAVHPVVDREEPTFQLRQWSSFLEQQLRAS